MEDEIFNSYQHLLDTVTRLKKAVPALEEDTYYTLYLSIMTEAGDLVDGERKPKVTIWMNDGPPEDFPIQAVPQHPYSNWSSYIQALTREFRTCCRNTQVNLEIKY